MEDDDHELLGCDIMDYVRFSQMLQKMAVVYTVTIIHCEKFELTNDFPYFGGCAAEFVAGTLIQSVVFLTACTLSNMTNNH